MEMEEKLIAAVAAHPVLYDKSHENYSNRAYITKQWTEIAKEIGHDVQVVRKRWTRLRDYFQRNHRMLTVKSESTQGRNKKWYLYDAMSFLIPYLASRSTANEISDESDNGSADNTNSYNISDYTVNAIEGSKIGASDTIVIENVRGSEMLDEDSSQVSIATSRGSRKRSCPYIINHDGAKCRPVPNFDVPMLQTDQDINLRVRTERTLDEDEMYCLSLASKMKMLDPVAKLECQIDINAILIRYLKQLPPDKIQANNQTVAYSSEYLS